MLLWVSDSSEHGETIITACTRIHPGPVPWPLCAPWGFVVTRWEPLKWLFAQMLWQLERVPNMQNYIVSHYLLCGSSVWTMAKKTCSSEKNFKKISLCKKKKSQHILLSVGNQVEEEENVNTKGCSKVEGSHLLKWISKFVRYCFVNTYGFLLIPFPHWRKLRIFVPALKFHSPLCSLFIRPFGFPFYHFSRF